MTESHALPEPTGREVRQVFDDSTGLADGNWHRLHPATPLLKGGIALIAMLGIIIANLRERLIDLFVGAGRPGEDPIDWVLSEGLLPMVLGVVALVLVLFVVGFYLSWRMHTFRITDEVVEVRSGILFRTNRRARLDRIQGINIVRPFFARLFGAAKLEVNQAGQDANVQLAYLRSTNADDLRRDILLLASGTQRAEQAAAEARAEASGSIIDRRVQELLAPELDPNAAPIESVVKMHAGRLAGAIALSETAIIFYLITIGSMIAILVSGEFVAAFGVIPAILGMGSYLVSRFTKSLRYSIAGTPDGVRIGYGLLSTSNETLPPGRVHSVQISQSLLWRGLGWWEVKVNRASRSSTQGAAGQANTTILPVGTAEDVGRVLALVMPDFDQARIGSSALISKGGDDGFVNSPPRAAVLRWFSWRRNGFAILPRQLVLRKGAIWRSLVIVPHARLQSVAVRQGPLLRWLRLAAIHVHTVAGPITPTLGAIDRDQALHFFGTVADAAVLSAAQDTTHRWRASEAAAAPVQAAAPVDSAAPVLPVAPLDAPAPVHVPGVGQQPPQPGPTA
ncbi:PH domain-containing protein [Diaminobutyricimonas sp. TR449]|uniref:PH domain-containing protein n=1 Tax=Diaminobutyricimonas sp. TR449 TaxID=2708076 RepID=UPI0014218DC3|nr:PH domain-containing protein [Diaminobutyricimonas sp. TR449]